MKINIQLEIGDRHLDLFRKIGQKLRSHLRLLTLVIGIPFALHAAPITKPFTFTANTVAKAAEVNSNFDTLYTQVNSNDARLTTLEQRKITTFIYGSAISIANPVATMTLFRSIGTFTKNSATSTLLVHWNSHVTTTGLVCSYTFCFDSVCSGSSENWVTNFSNASVPATATLAYLGVGAGTHTIALYVRGVSATVCDENSGNYSRQVVIEEIP